MVSLLSLLGVFLLEDGSSDPFYQRVASPRQNSLIIGTSRAAQGIKPSVINKILNLDDSTKIYNYSFTIMNSPYGEIYSKSIHQKLSKSHSNGIFILAVDPWAISSSKIDPNNIDFFSEKGLFLDRLVDVDGFINLQYLLNNYTNSFYEILLRKVIDDPTKLHSDGWLEIKLYDDEMKYRDRLREKLAQYRINLSNSSFSGYRFRSLLYLIEGLKKRGEVYLVRLPVDEEILKIEDELMPEFNALIMGASKDLAVPYLDSSTKTRDFKYTDGNHLQRGSAEIVSLEISEWIKELGFYHEFNGIGILRQKDVYREFLHKTA